MLSAAVASTRRLRLALLWAFAAALLLASWPARAPLALLPGDLCTSSLNKSLPLPVAGSHCPDCLPAALAPPPLHTPALRHELRHALAPVARAAAEHLPAAVWPPPRGPPAFFVFL